MHTNDSEIIRLSQATMKFAEEAMRRFNLDTLDPENLVEFLMNPSNIALAAINHGEVTGFLYGYILPRPDTKKPMLFLYSIDVCESHRKKGIGKQLVNSFLEAGKELNMLKAFVVTEVDNIAAINLYESCGGRGLRKNDLLYSWN